MRFEIAHTTRYRYEEPVFLEPHTIRLRPRSDPFQRLERFALEVSPEPAGASEILDAAGNAATVVWFDGTTDRLEVRTTAVVETLRPNPFDYLLTWPEGAGLPARYSPKDANVLAPYRAAPAEPADPVARFAREVADRARGDAVDFLSVLNDRLHRGWAREVREEGDAHPPERTLRDRRGSCRDLTVLFAAACRSMGLAARFVSGYQEGDPAPERRDMHAWSEVYLPGAGWRGYDPTLGLAVADRHVALAASAEPTGAAPTAGTLRGGGAHGRMAVDLEIHTRPSG